MAEIIAAIAVVISLLYLGVQIKRSRIQSENEAMDTLVNGRSNYLKILSEDTELSLLVAKGLSSKTKLTANEIFRFNNFLYVLFIGLETAFLKWKKHDVDTELWSAWDEVTHWWLRFPSVRFWWQHNIIGGYTQRFKTYLDGIMEEISREDPNLIEKQLVFMEEAGKK
jgi:hypothetical protein